MTEKYFRKKKLKRFELDVSNIQMHYIYHDFVLAGEIRWLAQQLRLRYGDRTWSLSYQNGVIKLHSRGQGNQILTLVHKHSTCERLVTFEKLTLLNI